MRPVIKVENLSKMYQLGTIGTGTLIQDIHRWWSFKKNKVDPYLSVVEENIRDTSSTSRYNLVWALKNINCDVIQGERLALIGANGSGKSTLLKIISQLTEPTEGSIKIKGRVASLLEVGTGFHGDLTGRENIYLNGAILGMNKQEVSKKIDAIIDFSGVERYIDTPIKRYSSGMNVRLGFSIAAHLQSEILIVDEVLAVGDIHFKKSCIDKMLQINNEEGRTILFVSHDTSLVEKLCTKSIVLSSGQILYKGNISEGVAKYLPNESMDYITYYKKEKIDKNKIIELMEASVCDINFNQKNKFFTQEDIFFKLKICKRKYHKKGFKSAVFIKTASIQNNLSSEYIIESYSNDLDPDILNNLSIGEHTFLLKVDKYILAQQLFELDINLIYQDILCDENKSILKFEVIEDNFTSLAKTSYRVKWKKL